MDYIERSIEKAEEFHASCKNCELVLRRNFYKGGFYCTGIVLFPLKELPFDTIRLCVLENEDVEEVEIKDFAPDEALTISNMLSRSSLEWLLGSKKYLEFRGLVEE